MWCNNGDASLSRGEYSSSRRKNEPLPYYFTKLDGERRSTQSRDPSPVEVDRSHDPPLPPGAGPGSWRAGRPAGDGRRGWRGRPTQTLPGRGRRGEMGSGENEGTSDWIPPPLPEGAVPGSHVTRHAADSATQMGPHRRSTQAGSQLGNRGLLAVRVDNSISRGLSSLPPGAAPGSQDSGGVGSWPC